MRRTAWAAAVLLVLAAPFWYQHAVPGRDFYPFEVQFFERNRVGWGWGAWVGGLLCLLSAWLVWPLRQRLGLPTGRAAFWMAVLASGGMAALLAACAVQTVCFELILHPGSLTGKFYERIAERVFSRGGQEAWERWDAWLRVRWSLPVGVWFWILWTGWFSWVRHRLDAGSLMPQLARLLRVAGLGSLAFFVAVFLFDHRWNRCFSITCTRTGAEAFGGAATAAAVLLFSLAPRVLFGEPAPSPACENLGCEAADRE